MTSVSPDALAVTAGAAWGRLRAAQQVRQLGEVHRHPPRLILRLQSFFPCWDSTARFNSFGFVSIKLAIRLEPILQDIFGALRFGVIPIPSISPRLP
jgi:hypothetical protein